LLEEHPVPQVFRQRATKYPLLYEVYTRAHLTALGRALGRSATLDDIRDSDLDRWAERGFDWVWMLGMWQTGTASRAVSRSRPDWRREFARALPDLSEDDICGSCFAVRLYACGRGWLAAA
jgi:hypothetical protein